MTKGDEGPLKVSVRTYMVGSYVGWPHAENMTFFYAVSHLPTSTTNPLRGKLVVVRIGHEVLDCSRFVRWSANEALLCESTGHPPSHRLPALGR